MRNYYFNRLITLFLATIRLWSWYRYAFGYQIHERSLWCCHGSAHLQNRRSKTKIIFRSIRRRSCSITIWLLFRKLLKYFYVKNFHARFHINTNFENLAWKHFILIYNALCVFGFHTLFSPCSWVWGFWHWFVT